MTSTVQCLFLLLVSAAVTFVAFLALYGMVLAIGWLAEWMGRKR